MRIFFALMFVLAACETRPPCEVVCSNEVRCGFSPSTESCLSMCDLRFAMSTMDCKVAIDSYQRCWSVAGSCPSSPSSSAPGCATEFNNQALACVRASPRPLVGTGGI